MGKSKKRSRASKARLNPLANNNDKGALNKKDANLVTKKIQPLLNQLKSSVPNDRNMALNSVTVLCEDPHMRGLFLKEKLIQTILTNLLTDENIEIVVESYGLLRNLALEEGYDVSMYLWRSDIWKSITLGFEKIVTSLNVMVSPSNDNTKSFGESKRLLFDFIDNLLSLVIALSNGSNSILDDILSTEKTSQLFQLIIEILKFGHNKNNLPTKVFNQILDFIYDFSSESFEFIDAVKENEPIMSWLTSLFTNPESLNGDVLTETLIKGIFLQFQDDNLTISQCEQLLSSLIKTTQETSLSLEKIERDLSVTIEDEELIKQSNNIANTGEKLKDYTKRRSLAQIKLQHIEISLDIITGTIESAAIIMTSNNNTTEDFNGINNLLLDPTMIPQLLLRLFDAFTARCLIIWNNLLWYALDAGFGVELVTLPEYKLIWDSIFKLNDEEFINKDIGVLIGKYSTIWVFLKIIMTIANKDESNQLLQNVGLLNNSNFITGLQNKLIITTSGTADNGNANEDLELKQKYVSVLNCLAMIPGQDVKINQQIGQFFLEQMNSENTVVSTTIDIFSSFCEIYSDGNFEYDETVFVQGGFLQILKDKIMPVFKSRFKLVDKNKEPELKERCREAFNTLERFIQYKETERS
ncbi:Syo1p NDAI_0D04390 [Naumovozyma dairenensis CBS 421]|uniref:SYO1-like TPR repeats domain-containing protein n=1 Tax=Naumovozyma dairenensis (strain ATCC 10597 / BCRC 20456 / CBS 421 / NBRC 0211 / NRRL Y-12639) TaxID=1071378 RepID=G0WAE2_NAUDC|nr:hypothetical protein NDAI_0D04390 [Naumovozyma dairenensis CBS 421]CCD24753.1 hypothetical protein NDAI_0D04390 [Naumovozyma dairenensis CBS 421]